MSQDAEPEALQSPLHTTPRGGAAASADSSAPGGTPGPPVPARLPGPVLGIDLAWGGGESGLCLLRPTGPSHEVAGLEVAALEVAADHAEVLARLDAWAGEGPCLVALDAPTRLHNRTGMRGAERALNRVFARHQAGCHPTNLGMAFAPGLLDFVAALRRRGLVDAPRLVSGDPGRHLIEVFPHPATVRLFGLERTLKYKRGPVAERRAALEELRGRIAGLLPRSTPAVAPAALPEVPAGGRALKRVEDRLDAVLCALVGARAWALGQDGVEVFGNHTDDYADGYIVVPRATRASDA